jgi:hypothetical protein
MTMLRKTLPVVNWFFYVCIFFAVVSGCTGEKSVSQSSSQSDLQIPSSELDLGALFETQPIKRVLHISNSSSTTLDIVRFSKSCDCTSLVPDSNIQIAPGETKVLEATLRIEPEAPKTPGLKDPPQQHVDLIATIRSAATERTRIWSLRYTVIPSIPKLRAVYDIGLWSHLKPDLHYELDIPLGDGASDIVVSQHSNWNVNISDALGSSGTSPPNKIKRIRFTWKGTQEPRKISDELAVTPISPIGTSLSSRRVRLVGEICTDVRPNPSAILLGRIQPGAHIQEEISLDSMTSRPFVITSCRLGKPSDLLSCKKMSETAFVITGVATRTEKYANWLSMSVRQDGQKDYSLIVPIRYETADEESRP